MTDIATVKENRSIHSDTGKTSPLSTLPTSSPTIKSDSHDQPHMTTDTDSARISAVGISAGVSDGASRPTAASPNGDSKKVDSLSARSKSIVSDESSDLSELDSEAETEKMFNGEESMLKKIAKLENGDESTMQVDNETENNDTFIKEEIIDELRNQKNDSEVDEGSNEDISTVVKELNQNNKTSRSSSVSKSKRKLNEIPEEATKRRKTEEQAGEGEVDGERTDEIEGSKEPFVDEVETTNDQEQNSDGKSVHQALTEANGEDEDEAVEAAGEEEDEEEEEEPEDEEEDEEVELTEEQKLQKQQEAEAELQKQKIRKEAIDFLTEIEVDFAKLRDRLYEDKMARYKSEVEMCLNGSHPELQTVYSKIDAVRNDKVRLAEVSRKYKLESIDRKTRAQRTAIHQQYYKRVFDVKHNFLKTITEDWYKINKERRHMDSLLPDYTYRIPEYTDELVSQREQVNEEISLLVGLTQYFGFPKAPELKSLDGDDLDSDLKAMNIPT